MIGHHRIRLIARRLATNMPDGFKERVDAISFAIEQELDQSVVIEVLSEAIESDADLHRWASYINMDRRDGGSRFRDAFEKWAVEHEIGSSAS